ncbi:MAG: phenylalanine--tRNA ligase subunit beta [Bacteroidales bacterium]
MKISYNWLKDYISDLPSPDKTSEILTSIGLEVEGLEKFESVKGGMDGIVIGKVLSCKKHPDADKLSVTTVDIGNGDPLPIVCGAPNVAEGQKVAVATVGTTLYMGDDKLTLKKVKIRGEVSEGMICAEDELGLGEDHTGILVLDENAKVGTPAREYFNIETDYVFEIGLTPNRIDGGSHIGVARDLAAYFRQTKDTELKKPDVSGFKVDNTDLEFDVKVEDSEGCPRYSGISITNLKVEESPQWLKNRLKAIGLNPINNVVDITNYVLHETGQPLHAFDAEKVAGNKVIIKTLNNGTSFTTLDEEERKLSAEDLMICNEKEGMCIAGVFGGIDSGVTESTKAIFLESAYFNPVYIRKTARRHMLSTDSSFRFERGSDPNMTIYAAKRAAMLMQEIAGGKVSSEIVDIYPEKIADFKVSLEYSYLNILVGKVIEKDKVRNILSNLDVKIDRETDDTLELSVPPYRVDVQRPADVVEEILRIYGYNNVEIHESLVSALSYIEKPDSEKINNLVSEMLSANGFSEIMANSLTKADYYVENDRDLVKIFNPLSNDLNAMRKTLLYGGLEAIEYNRNRKNPDLKLYEFGNVYFSDPDIKDKDPHKKYSEEYHLGLFLTGKTENENWLSTGDSFNYYHLKAYVSLILRKLGINPWNLETSEVSRQHFTEGIQYKLEEKEIVSFGIVSRKLCNNFDINTDVLFAEFNWNHILENLKGHKTQYQPVSRYPEVKRDLSMMLDRKVNYDEIRAVALQAERKLLKDLEIFDVYEGDKIEKGKKSYAISFTLQDENQTLKDKQIDKAMNRISSALESKLGAQIRS